MNIKYNEALSKIAFYEIHPEYMPFVGDKYDEFKILHIGESHYIPQLTNEKDIFPIDYFEKWWTDSCDDLKSFSNTNSGGEEWRWWFVTQNVIANYLAGKRTRSHGIFTNLVKAFAEVCQNRTLPHITVEESQNYRRFAFMNFFQMPALYEGMKFWDSLKFSANRLGLTKKEVYKYAEQVWDKAAKESSEVLDRVIDALQPSLIIFTSKSAYGAYTGKYKDAPNMIMTVHPGCKYWNNPSNDQNGKKQLIEKWKEMLKDNK